MTVFDADLCDAPGCMDRAGFFVRLTEAPEGHSRYLCLCAVHLEPIEDQRGTLIAQVREL